MRKSRLTYTTDGDDDNAVSGQVRSDGKASGMNVFVSGHSSITLTLSSLTLIISGNPNTN